MNKFELFAEFSGGDLPVKLPNIPFPTMGGEIWWNDLDENNGWRLQQNTLLGHCRILDPDNWRRDSGSRAAMERVFLRMSEHN